MPQMNRATEMGSYVGASCKYRVDNGLVFECTIVDVRSVYGTTQALIKPVAGSSAAWVSLFKLDVKGV